MPTNKKAQLNLVTDGVFPIKYKSSGHFIDNILDTSLQHPGTLQCEGKLIGYPSLFIRTSGCNLKCAWVLGERGDLCDTPFSSWNAETNLIEVDEVVAMVRNNIENMRHVVITGGEPMIQDEPLVELCTKLKKMGLHITLETNGTLFTKEVAEVVDLFSISPKLSNSIPWLPNLRETGIEYNERRALRHNQIRKNLKVLQAFIDSCYVIDPNSGTNTHRNDYVPANRRNDKDFQLKFVISGYSDISEIKNEILSFLRGVEPSDIILMPLGSNKEGLDLTTKITMSEVIKNGWRYTPRLHIDMFGTKRSV